MLQSCNWSLVGACLCLCASVNKNEMNFYSNINYKVILMKWEGWYFLTLLTSRKKKKCVVLY